MIRIRDIDKTPDLLKALEDEKERILSLVGAFLEDQIKKTISHGRAEWPPLSPETIKRKGSSKPLLDTGHLRDSITHKVEGNAVKVGVFGEEAIIAAVHEFGTTRAGRGHKVVIPARPFIRPTFDENIQEVEKIVGREVEKVIRRL
ncbi:MULTISPECIES: HK97-gp10 family putative phage morphogenesis protein [unclassified Archaeoglobus]|jgi:phage virion morphogenesis protein|uniref:HK97-gp10 family putative phage morphogenesis protein n=1 Tax=unclassified Archaeoglobus TaxID=2643606 RepID=UPI0025BE3BDB|nr:MULTISPECIES: HK97-gp10 family putative phage morphogenesis protein [unclassified Archaeoglobus]